MAAKGSSPHHHQGRGLVLRKTGAFLLWLLIIFLIFLIPFEFAPNPYRVITRDDHINQWHAATIPANDTVKSVNDSQAINSDDHINQSDPTNGTVESVNDSRAVNSDDHVNQSDPAHDTVKSVDDLRAVVTEDDHVQQQHAATEPANSTIKPTKDRDVGREEKCDLSKGKWVRDESGPEYTNRSCPTMPESKNCGKYGKDQDFVNWRWKPEGCELPRFDGTGFLNTVRGKKLAFVGDSVARNQMESLLCLLSQVETPQDVYKDDEDRFRTWYFPSHNFTLMVLWTKFLVEGEERVPNGTASSYYDLHVDKVDMKWSKEIDQINYVVISSGHWFYRKIYLHEGGKRIGCVFCSEGNLRDYGVSYAIGRAFRASLQFINKCKGCQVSVTFLRTFAPAHFENGMWNAGGYCNRTRPSNEGDVSFSGTDWDVRTAQVKELKRVQTKDKRGMKQFRVLDVTRAMMMRPDGHPGTHWNNDWNKDANDCVHWCMPGVVDMWNHMLQAVLKKDTASLIV